MAERVITVSLRAQVNDYIAGMEKARKKTSETGTEAEKLAQKKEAFDLLGRASLAMGVAIAAGLVLAASKYAEFEQAMSNVQAATHATAAEQKLLSDAAIEAGASTVFSAKESANAIEELSKAGLDTADILGGALKGSLDLASAGELGVARAAEIASTTLQQFKLDGGQAGHVADVLAAGAGKAMGSVEDLANGLKFVGPVANAMGISLEQTTGVLALFAQQGIIGEQAGTSLRGVLGSLTSPSKLARGEIEKLGLTLYDSNGKFLGLENAAGELAGAYRGMDDASRDASLGIIFGRETITAATTLYQAGAEGVAKWTKEVDDSGYAAITARARLDNLKGDVEALGGAFDTALIQTGSAGNDALRMMAQTLTNVIDLYNEAPEPVKVATLALAGITAAALLAGGAFLLGAPKVAQFNAALATMGPTAQKAGSMLTAAAGPIGLAFTAASIAIAIFASEQAAAKARVDAFSDTIDTQTGKLTDSTRELVAANLSAKRQGWFIHERSSIFDVAEKLGLSLDLVTDAALGNAGSLKELAGELKRYEEAAGGKTARATELGYSSLREYEEAVQAVNSGITSTTDSIEGAIKVTQQKATADKEAAKTSNVHEKALAGLQGKAKSTSDAVEDLADTIRGFGSATLSVREANRNLEESYDSLAESVANNGRSLDISTEKGRANQSAIDDIAKATLEAAAATAEQTGSQAAAIPVIEAGRAKLIEMLAQFNITGDAANAYIDELGLIPANIATAVEIHTADAQAQMDNFVHVNNGRKVFFDLGVNGPATIAGTGLKFFADGGAASGPGGPRGDKIPAMLSDGEHVLDAEDVRRMGGQAAVYRFREGLSRGYADGGAVRYAPQPQIVTVRSDGPSTGGTSVHITAPAIETQDPQVYATIIGREFARRLAG